MEHFSSEQLINNESIADIVAATIEELDDAAVYAANEGFEAVASSLTVEIDNNVESLALTPEKVVLKLRGVISNANRLYLKELISNEADLEEIISAAYGMILEEGEAQTKY